MIPETLGLILFIVTMVASPGPANVVLFALGTKQNIKRSIPFIISVVLSKQLIIWPIGLGIMITDNISNQYQLAMNVISLFFILWIGYKIVMMDFSLSNSPESWSPKFYHGLMVHPMNPKAWLMVSLSFTAYHKSDVTLLTIPGIAVTFLFIQLLFHTVWFSAGSLLRKSEVIEKKKNLVKLILIVSLVASIIFTYN